MKKTARLWTVLVGVSLTCAVSSLGGFVTDTFDSYTNGTLLNGANQWKATSSSQPVAVQTNVVHWGSKSAVVPMVANLSNVVSVGTVGTNVWSDFWTVPRFYVSDSGVGPAADTNATAMFYIASNGYWTVVSGPNGSVTNVITTNAWGTAVAKLNEATNWIHVSVYHDYGAKKWSLFVNDTPLATNLSFINSTIANYQWFNMQNGGGDSAWIDDVTITNKVPYTLATDFNHDGMIDAWAWMYFGTFFPPVNSSAAAPGGLLTYGQKSMYHSNPFDLNDPGSVPGAYPLPFSDYFDALAQRSLWGQDAWGADPSNNVMVQTRNFTGGQGVGVLAGQASHTFSQGPGYSSNPGYTNVWTHLVLMPTLMNDDTAAGTPDAGVTVAYYVGTNGYVHAFSNNTWVTLANILTPQGGPGPACDPITGTNWVRFVTKSDYVQGKWSLYMAQQTSGNSNFYARPIGINLGFNSLASLANGYQGVYVTNFPDANTTGYLDNVEITLNNNVCPWVDTDGDGVPDWFEIQSGFDPNSAASVNFPSFIWGTTNTITPPKIAQLVVPTNVNSMVRIQFKNLVANWRYYVLWGNTPPHSPLTNVIGYLDTGWDGLSDTFSDNTALDRGNRGFYQIASSAPDGNMSETNLETYAWYKQPVAATNTWVITGIPVDYGTNNRLDGLLGKHLARALKGGADLSTAKDFLQIAPPGGGTFTKLWLRTDGTWHDGNPVSTQAVAVGSAVVLQRGSDPQTPGLTDVILAGMQQTNRIANPISQNWNALTWAYDNTSLNWGFTNALVHGDSVATNGDMIYLQRNGKFVQLLLDRNNVWRVGPGYGAIATNVYSTLQPGEGFMYRSVNGGWTWNPPMP